MRDNFSLIMMCIFLLASLAFLAQQITAYHQANVSLRDTGRPARGSVFGAAGDFAFVVALDDG